MNQRKDAQVNKSMENFFLFLTGDYITTHPLGLGIGGASGGPQSSAESQLSPALLSPVDGKEGYLVQLCCQLWLATVTTTGCLDGAG